MLEQPVIFFRTCQQAAGRNGNTLAMCQWQTDTYAIYDAVSWACVGPLPSELLCDRKSLLGEWAARPPWSICKHYSMGMLLYFGSKWMTAPRDSEFESRHTVRSFGSYASLLLSKMVLRVRYTHALWVNCLHLLCDHE